MDYDGSSLICELPLRWRAESDSMARCEWFKGKEKLVLFLRSCFSYDTGKGLMRSTQSVCEMFPAFYARAFVKRRALGYGKRAADGCMARGYGEAC